MVGVFLVDNRIKKNPRYIRVTTRSGAVHGFVFNTETDKLESISNVVFEHIKDMPPALHYFKDIRKEQILGILDLEMVSDDQVMAGELDHALIEILDQDGYLLDEGNLGYVGKAGNCFHAEVKGLEKLL